MYYLIKDKKSGKYYVSASDLRAKRAGHHGAFKSKNVAENKAAELNVTHPEYVTKLELSGSSWYCEINGKEFSIDSAKWCESNQKVIVRIETDGDYAEVVRKLN
jgi:hypothetical protein